MKLAAKLIGVFLVPVVLLTWWMAYRMAHREFQCFRQGHEQGAHRLARALERQLIAAWQEGGQHGVVRALRDARFSDDHFHVRWVWFDAQQGAVDGPQLEQPLPAVSRQLTLVCQHPDGQQRLQTYCPVPLEGERTGGLEISESLAPVRDQTRRVYRSALLSVLGTGGLATAIVILAGGYLIGRPLNQLIRKTRQAGCGEFDEPLMLQGGDELYQLGQALNEMCEQVKHQQEKLRAESESRMATLQQLRHADRLKTVGRLAAGIAHEMGTPLNVISGRAALIGTGKLSEDEVRDSATTIKSEADRITAIIRQLLDFARKKTPRAAPVDLGELVQRTTDLLRSLAAKRNVTVHVELKDQPLVTLADAGQLQQVMSNIMVNAMQSMPEGGPVHVRLYQARVHPPEDVDAPVGDYLCVQVQDRGVGIAPEDLEHIFEPFFTTKGVGEGTGLGLSIAYGIVQEHGGWIGVESRPAEGSCFTIYLPRREQHDPALHD